MTIQVPETNKAYYVMVNHPEMVERAVEQGLEKPILIQSELDEDDLESIYKTRKVIVFYYFAATDDEENLVKKVRLSLENMGATTLAVDSKNVLFHDNDDDVVTLQDNIRLFPTLSEFEDYLSGKSEVLTRNYENRCGNCHTFIRPDEKYCRKCGTERGKGSFEPFHNVSYGVYGPQVKVKYKCKECGHIWITNDLGGDYSEFCPQCGKKNIYLQQDEIADDFFGYFGTENPYDETARPVLLSEEQIDAVIANKECISNISDKELVALMDKCNIPVSEQLRDETYGPMSEADGDRLTLVSRIQLMAGNNPKGYKGVSCPNCKSEYVASIAYSIWGPESNEKIADGITVEGGTKDALVYRFGGGWQYGKDKPSNKKNAYMCLCCGTKYGIFDVPKNWERAYKLKTAAKGAKDVAQNIGYATIGLGVVAGEKAKPFVENIGDKIGEGIKNMPKIELPKKKQDDTVANNEGQEESKDKAEVKAKLDDELRQAVDTYNSTYTELNDYGMKLFVQRERSIDLLTNIENLINSIANHPKSFDTDVEEIIVNRTAFKDVCEYAEQELQAAKKAATSVGSGVAGGLAVASMAPSAAMWVATTFGTASTGTAISTLSGAAATNAALAWLGGGALSIGGGGMAAGQAFLALAGPIGWSIAGATLLTSIVLFANKKIKLNKEKKDEIESVLKNTESLREVGEKIRTMLEKTESLREKLTQQYNECLTYYQKDFGSIPEKEQFALGTLVNNAKALSVTLGEEVQKVEENEQ